MQLLKKIIVIFLTLSLLFTFTACGSGKSDYPDKINIEMSVTDFGIIKLELYHDIAPITVENFVTLVKSGFYDGLIFHRVIENFMIQSGDPTATGTGGSNTKIKGEFSANGVENNLKHERGVISMARSSVSMDSASSQFFICQTDYPSLNGKYAAFGKVTEGLEVVDKIAAVKCKKGSTSEKSIPVTPVVIEYIKVID